MTILKGQNSAASGAGESQFLAGDPPTELGNGKADRPWVGPADVVRFAGQVVVSATQFVVWLSLVPDFLSKPR